MRFPSLTRTRSPLPLLLATILIAALALTIAGSPAAAGATIKDVPPSGTELLSNPDFRQGSTGWRTNGSNQTLSILSGTNPVAQLTTRTTGNATLNDAPNAVQSTVRGRSYIATARVRTTTPGVDGALRIREVNGSQVTTSQTPFQLNDTQWQTITLNVTTTYAQSHLDFNLVAWSLPTGRNFQAQWVSLKAATGTAPVAPPKGSCDAPPPKGTIFGANAWDVGKSMPEALQEIDTAFGRVPVVRHFSSGMPLSWKGTAASQLKGRTLVTSFKIKPSEITSGRHDAFFRDWFATAPSNQTIYWSYYHEPENNINAGEFTAAQYRAAWSRLGKIADEACRPNMYATLILTEWTMNSGSKRDYRTYDAGKDAVDVIAFDPYYAMWHPTRDYYETPEKLLEHIVVKMKADGRPWAIAELGTRIVVGDDGRGRAAWLKAVGDYAKRNNALWVTYFNAIGNADWRLRDSQSKAAWKSLVTQ